MQHNTINDNTSEAIPAEPIEHAFSLEHQLCDAEAVTNELKRLLVRYETTLEQEGIRQKVEILERWMESYRRGLSAASKISANGTTWLSELRETLKLAAEELQRMEDEGGNPANSKQAEQAEDMRKATRRIDKMIPTVEQLLSGYAEAEVPVEDVVNN